MTPENRENAIMALVHRLESAARDLRALTDLDADAAADVHTRLSERAMLRSMNGGPAILEMLTVEPDLRRHSWRVGRSVGRTVYIQLGDDPSKEDRLIGVMDTPEIARFVVETINRQVW